MRRRWLRKLHRGLGLSVGLWAAITAMTGTVLVFGPEIDRWLNPQLLRVAPQSDPVEIDVALAAVHRSFPGATLHSLRLPQAADEPLLVRLGEPSRNVYVDPYRGIVLGSRAPHGGLIGWLHDLHVQLFAGEAGGLLVGVLAGLCAALIAMGLALGWRSLRAPARAAPRDTRSPGAPPSFRFHRTVGVVGSPLMLVAVVTGLMLAFHQASTTLLIRALGGPALPSVPTVTAGAGAGVQPLHTLIEAADAALPGAHPTYVILPAAPDAALVVRQRFAANPHPNGRSFVAMDPYTGAVLRVHDWRAAGVGVRVSDFKLPLHIGQAFGLPGRIVTAAAGLLPLALLISGAALWWRRRRRSAARRAAARCAHETVRGAA